MRYRPLLYISAISSVLYLIVQNWQPLPGSAAIKGCAAGALALLAFQMRSLRQDAGLLALALALCSAGDVLLDLHPRYFPLGLGAFLLAHFTYIAVFARSRARPLRPGLPRTAGMLGVLAYSTAFSAWIVPSTGALAVPVVLYICALTAMVSLAILSRAVSAWVPAGALLFLLSDSLLAINRFKTPVPLHTYLIWSTYYAGQCGIALGFLAGSQNAPRMRAAEAR